MYVIGGAIRYGKRKLPGAEESILRYDGVPTTLNAQTRVKGSNVQYDTRHMIVLSTTRSTWILLDTVSSRTERLVEGTGFMGLRKLLHHL